ncbi:hypothetical protein AVEN_250976-1 [Araneus ventricosus]|uniref:Uncharacterized protein n=1 Tax=Araneus ventricosus TaxID=182803 RepID=A0A4Y2TST7_ARAVE|nr:hypothetical protein AVEN_250976-1 [Araneus ventricosus]
MPLQDPFNHIKSCGPWHQLIKSLLAFTASQGRIGLVVGISVAPWKVSVAWYWVSGGPSGRSRWPGGKVSGGLSGKVRWPQCGIESPVASVVGLGGLVVLLLVSVSVLGLDSLVVGCSGGPSVQGLVAEW